ncbi:hypothetical protein OSI78_25160, partial [Mycobacterium ulcerans]
KRNHLTENAAYTVNQTDPTRPANFGLGVVVKRIDGSHRLEGTWSGAGSANAFLSHLDLTRRLT